MTTPSRILTPRSGDVRSRWPAVVVAFLVAVSSANVVAQAPAASAAVASEIPAVELEQLVARIALYPDDLVAIILPASTNPLQLVQADRFLDKRKADPKLPIDDKWDDSVKSLLNYPEVVKSMSGDLDWTSALGEAVVADQGAVLDAVQAFRRKTQAAGNLKSDTKQVVVVEKEVIKIVPADPQVIYVPQYNPTTVVAYGGYSAWGYYPTPYPVYYYPYPPGAALAAGVIWGAAIGAAWHGGHYVSHYGGGNANIDINRNTNINTGDVNVGRGAGASARPTGGTSQWKPDKQPGQVSSSIGKTGPSTRAGDARAGGGGMGSAGGGAARPSTQPAGGGSLGGGADHGASVSGGAFSPTGSARQTQMDSSRGAASRSAAPAARPAPSSSMGARPAPSGGGARAGGGGGRGGGRR